MLITFTMARIWSHQTSRSISERIAISVGSTSERGGVTPAAVEPGESRSFVVPTTVWIHRSPRSMIISWGMTSSPGAERSKGKAQTAIGAMSERTPPTASRKLPRA